MITVRSIFGDIGSVADLFGCPAPEAESAEARRAPARRLRRKMGMNPHLYTTIGHG